MAAACLLGVLWLGLSGCASGRLRPDFDSPYPTAKMYAIEQAVRDGQSDQKTILRIIEQLDSDDPAVRFVAISALERLTGDTHGYDHTAPRLERDKAIARWVEAYPVDPAAMELKAKNTNLSPQRSRRGGDG